MILPVTVDSLVRIEEGAREVLEPAGFSVKRFSAEGDAARFTPVLQTALNLNPPAMVVVGTQLTDTLLGDKFRSGRPPFVAAAIFDPSALQGPVNLSNVPRPLEMAIVSDLVPDEGKQLADLAQLLVPAVRSIGVLTNRGEQNSVSSARETEQAFSSRGIRVRYGYLSSAADLAPVTRSLLMSGVDLIVIPHDKIAVGQASTVVDLALRYDTGRPRPVLSLDDGTVEKHMVLACVSANYRTIGAEAAHLFMSMTQGHALAKAPVVRLEKADLVVNRAALKRLGLKLPSDTPASIRWVE